MTKKILLWLLLAVTLLLFVTGCAKATPEAIVEPTPPEPTEAVVPTEKAPLPFEGIWFTHQRDSMLIITEDKLYMHEFGPNREVYARIKSYNLRTEKIEVFIEAIYIGGQSMGYDSPNVQISYHVNGTVMEFLGQHIDFYPDEDGPVLFIYDESLN